MTTTNENHQVCPPLSCMAPNLELEAVVGIYAGGRREPVVHQCQNHQVCPDTEETCTWRDAHEAALWRAYVDAPTDDAALAALSGYGWFRHLWGRGMCACVPAWEGGDWAPHGECFIADMELGESLRVTLRGGEWMAGRLIWRGAELHSIEVNGYATREEAQRAAEFMPAPPCDNVYYANPRDWLWCAHRYMR